MFMHLFPRSIESMTKDFTPQMEKPLWPMSSYGPAKYEPILVSNLDESPEELRVRAMTAIKSGSISDYVHSPLSHVLHELIYNTTADL